MTLLATNIREFRKRQKKTQDELARYCKVSGAAVSQWESKKNPTTPELDKARLVAEFFGTTIEHLMTSKNLDIDPGANQELSSRLLTKVFVGLYQTEGIETYFVESNLSRKAMLFKALYTLYSGMASDKKLNDTQLMKYIGLEEALPKKSKKKKKKKDKKDKE